MGKHCVLLTEPAGDFTASLQIGNGRLGANVYGETLREQLVINESSMWSGSREEADRPDAWRYLPEIRRLLREGKEYEAQQLFAQHFVCAGRGSNFAHGSDVPFGCYQLAGRLLLSYFQTVSHGRQDSCNYREYRRELDLDRAVASVSFRIHDTRYRREYFVSADYQGVVVHLTADRPGEIDVSIALDRDENYRIDHAPADFPALMMTGQLPDGKGGGEGVRYACCAGARIRGGRLFMEQLRMHIAGADEAWIFVTARTDLRGFMGREGGDPEARALADLQTLLAADPADVMEKHLAWYKRQYDTMTLTFAPEGTDPALENMPMDQRIARFRAGGADPELLALYVLFARHQLIASSQPDGFPANLQGIFADEVITPWNGDWHLNAQQMIYWLAEKGNLSENHLPFLRLNEMMLEPGRHTAQCYYHARGWLAHTFTNPWGFTSPGEDASWGSTTGSPAWQCHHLWEHYLYTLDRDYLAWAYPIMKEAALFYLDMLVENERGQLVTSPSSSPENWYLDSEGREVALCEGPAYDRELVAALFDSILQAQRVLKDDAPFAAEVREKLGCLAPVEIASDGRIMEWSREYREARPYHRHVSHLWGVYPGSLISMEKTPALGEAAKKSLIARKQTTAGWAIAMRGCIWARLREPEMAYGTIRDAFTFAISPNLMDLAFQCDENERVNNALQPDLERTRNQFQMDGNQGNATTLLMMLLDDDLRVDEDGEPRITLYLLPALPKALPEGAARGLKAKGNLTVDLTWSEGRLRSWRVEGRPGTKVTVCYGGKTEEAVLPVCRGE